MEPDRLKHIDTDVEVEQAATLCIARHVKTGRGQFVNEPHHFRHFDPRWIRELKDEKGSRCGLVRDLKRLGAGDEGDVPSAVEIQRRLK
jgi:hypothetical protein